MVELIALLILGAIAVGAILLLGLVFKLLFKVVLFPVWLALGLAKLVLGLVAAVLCLVIAPLALLLFLFVGLPLLALFVFVGLGWTLVAA